MLISSAELSAENQMLFSPGLMPEIDPDLRSRLQPLTHPRHGCTQSSIHCISLSLFLGVTSYEASMLNSRKVPIIERHALLLHDIERPGLEKGRVHRIDLRSKHLHGHLWRDRIDVRVG